MAGKQNRKSRKAPISTQETIPLQKVFQDGTVRSPGGYYTAMVKFSDANYCLLDESGQAETLALYGKLLNYFDSNVHFQLFLFNRKGNSQALAERFHIPTQGDSFDGIREEFSGILKSQAKKGTNGVLKGKYLIFGIHAGNDKEARQRLSRISQDVLKLLSELGTQARAVEGKERLFLLYEFFHQDTMRPFRFSWKDMVLTGKSPRDYIAPASFDFTHSSRYRSGGMYGSVFYFDIVAAELTDEVLKHFLDLDKNLTISIHMETMESGKAQKLLRSKLSEVQKRKIDEQKKAFQGGYDIDILPSDIVLYEKETQELLRELNSSNQKLIRFSFFLNCFGKTKKELADLEGQVNGLAEQANCELIPLTYNQEQGMTACTPLGINLTEMGETFNTNCAAILIPFHTQELFTRS